MCADLLHAALATMSGKEDDPLTGKDSFLGGLVESAAQVLAPNSLQFNEHEFQRYAVAWQLPYHGGSLCVHGGVFV